MTDRKTFDQLGLSEELTSRLADDGIVHPFPIQELALPIALRGADVIGQARTGTGKTLAFGLCVLERVDPETPRVQALIVTPTRELCLQVTDDLQIGAARGLEVTPIYGGVGYDEQLAALDGRAHIVVGTPGRLLDHLGSGALDLSGVRELVLDEADEMLDMGFLPDVERLIEATPDGRHTMLFSATMPSAVVKLARRYMDRPTFLRAEAEQEQTAPNVEQHFFFVHRLDKPRILARILQSPDRGGVYVFTRTKFMADRLVQELDTLGVDAIPIHGDLRQSSRERNMDRFRDGKVDVLVATEVAARGLDVENVTHVVNYDCPDDEKMYLHRIGRTARAGAAGVAVTFAEFNEVDRLRMIRKAVGADDGDIDEVFSTSDRLTQLFDLPDEKPWDHLARDSGRTGRRGGARSGGAKGGGARSSGPKGGGAKSGQAKIGQATGGGATRGGDRTSPRPTRGTSDRSDERGRDRTSAGARDAARTDGDGDGRRRARRPGRQDPPARTRTRTRRRSTGDGDATDGDRERAAASGSSGRQQGRDRGRGGETTPSRGETTAGARPARPRARRADRDTQPASGEADGRRRSGARNGAPSDPREPSRRDEPARDARQRAHERPAERGAPARGDGQPTLARRVRVEHLP